MENFDIANPDSIDQAKANVVATHQEERDAREALTAARTTLAQADERLARARSQVEYASNALTRMVLLEAKTK